MLPGSRGLLDGDVAKSGRLDRPVRAGVYVVERNARDIGLIVDELLADDEDPHDFRPTPSYVTGQSVDVDGIELKTRFDDVNMNDFPINYRQRGPRVRPRGG